MILSIAHTFSPPAPSHAAAPAGEASETQMGPHNTLRFPSGTRVRSACPSPSASSRRVTRSQGTISTRNPAAKKPIVDPLRRAPNRAHHPHTSPSPLTDHSGHATSYPTRNLAAAAEQKQHPPTPNQNITGDCDSNRTEGPEANTAFSTAASPTSPPPRPPTENTRDVRHQSMTTQEPMMAAPGASLKALVNLQADELQKF